jgi:hypothetical protein
MPKNDLQPFSFSEPLIVEYQDEMSTTYGVVVSAEDAQVELHSLTRGLFGNATGAGAGATARHRTGASEVGDSITPTSGHLDK